MRSSTAKASFQLFSCCLPAHQAAGLLSLHRLACVLMCLPPPALNALPPLPGNGRLGEALGLTAMEAAQEKAALLGSMPGLKAWLDRAKQQGAATGGWG